MSSLQELYDLGYSLRKKYNKAFHTQSLPSDPWGWYSYFRDQEDDPYAGYTVDEVVFFIRDGTLFCRVFSLDRKTCDRKVEITKVQDLIKNGTFRFPRKDKVGFFIDREIVLMDSVNFSYDENRYRTSEEVFKLMT